MADFVLTTQQTLIAHLCNMLQKPGEFETSREKYIWETTENNCRNETKTQTINDKKKQTLPATHGFHFFMVYFCFLAIRPVKQFNANFK